MRALVPDWLRHLLWMVRSRSYRQDVALERRRLREGEPALPAGPIRHVMFVCQGNICRSPFAERHLASLCPGLAVRSSGLKTREGSPAQPGALLIGREWGLALDDHGSHPLDAGDVAWADVIFGMQGWHEALLLERHPEARGKMMLLGDFLPGEPHLIADPWGRDDTFFKAVFERIATANERVAVLLREDDAQPASRS